MAQRFGRNQKRRLQEKIASFEVMVAVGDAQVADLSARLTKSSKLLTEAQTGLLAFVGAGYQLADGEELLEIPMAAAISSRLTEESTRNELEQRTAEVTLSRFVMTQELSDALYDRYSRRKTVAFRGLRWYIDEIRLEDSGGYGSRRSVINEDVRVVVHMTAIARP